jgi:hypothetical protein
MTTPARKNIPKRTQIAYHEAGHAVLSASINDAPHLVSIVKTGRSLGRARYKTIGAPPPILVQVHLAGYAAEHLLSSRRPPAFVQGLSMCSNPSLSAFADLLSGSDEALAVEQVLAMGCSNDAAAINRDVDRFYVVARESVASVWQAVQAVAKALLKHNEIDREGFFDAIADLEIYSPVVAVQTAHGLGRA